MSPINSTSGRESASDHCRNALESAVPGLFLASTSLRISWRELSPSTISAVPASTCRIVSIASGTFSRHACAASTLTCKQR